MTRALLVYPEFRSASFWNYREPCKLLDAQVPTAPLGLCTVAALLPSDWKMRLIDRNVEKLTDADTTGRTFGPSEVREKASQEKNSPR